jgi:hypothetical protein
MKVLIPETWNDITLNQFQNYTSEMKKDINQTTRLIQTISSLCNINFTDATKMKIKDVKKIASDIYNLLQIKPNTFINIFEFKKVKYAFIPKLDDITIGEYADLEFYLSDTDKMWDNMHWIMSILYREIKEEKDGKYIIEDYAPSKDRANIFKNIGMDIVYSASNFFLTLGEELIETMPSYIQEKEKQQMTKILQEIQNGGGSESSTTLQEGTLQNLKKWKNNN